MHKKIIIPFFYLLFSINLFAIERQQATNWCWVACVQDVVAQAGYYETQTQVAARLTGWPQNRPAYINEVVNLVKSYGIRAWQAQRPGSPQELYNTLTSGWKIIAFVKPSNGPVGHYIVLQGIDNFGNIIVSDPATGYTYPNSPNQLYFAWRWIDSVIVG
ncbi:MAG: papain-like cysteine protease family protein [Ignavibacteria bacterium]|nr:papain-like cysteine protease family protein [Ignavibacteria bacterium]